MLQKGIFILLAVFVFSCAGKKEKQIEENKTNVVLKKEIDSIESITEKIELTGESIEVSIEKLDELLNEINN